MRYIIDANNLAGKLGLLNDDKFDQELIGLVLHYFGTKKHEVNLVFDGSDRFGDKRQINNLRIIRAPRDGRNQTADDKIVDMVRYLNRDELKQAIIVTDDAGLLARIKEEELDKGVDAAKISAREFALMIQGKYDRDSMPAEEDDKAMPKKDLERINDELMNIWKDE